MKRNQKSIRTWICRSAIGVSFVYASVAFGKTDVPVFLFSGQSNMVCLGASASDLSADQKKTIDDIKIDSRADQNTKTWASLAPGFGQDASHFGPELFFGRTLADSMPGKKIAFIKDASSGTYLGKTDGWLPPSSSGGPGTLYKNMMTHIDKALATFSKAFDTAQYSPRWAGFVWLQGEFDGWQDKDKAYADAYETNLTNLIRDIRAKTGVEDLPVILEMIVASTNNWKFSATIRAADIACTQKLKNVDTMDTKGFTLSSDNIHYNAASTIKIGSISALRWLNMHFNYGTTTPIIAHDYTARKATASQPQMTSFPVTALFDMSGRRIALDRGVNPLSRTISPHCVLISTGNRCGEMQRLEKKVFIGR